MLVFFSHFICFFLSSPSPLLPFYLSTNCCITSHTNSHSNHIPLSNPICLCMRLSTAAACFVPFSFKIQTNFSGTFSGVSCFWGVVLEWTCLVLLGPSPLHHTPPPLPLAPASLLCSPQPCLRPLLTQALSVDKDTPPRPGDGVMHSSGRSFLSTIRAIGDLENKTARQSIRCLQTMYICVTQISLPLSLTVSFFYFSICFSSLFLSITHSL